MRVMVVPLVSFCQSKSRQHKETSKEETMKILIIEDDPAIVETVSLAFQMRWPEAELVTTNLGGKGIELVETESPDVVILDLGLPDIDGFDVLKQVRLFSEVPIIIVTVREEETNIVKGLEWGADEYIVKPFRPLVFMAQVQALVRRQHVPSADMPLVYGPLRLDHSMRKLINAKREINLTSTEGIILYHLMRNANKVVTLPRLAEAVWGEEHPSAADAIRVYIRRLREKIETDPSHPQFIHTETGLGYTLKKPG